MSNGMTGKQMSTAANRINERLRTARKKYPNSDYTNELERRIVMMGKASGLVIITPNGPQLTRSRGKWAAANPAAAQAVLDACLEMGQVNVMEYNVDQALEAIGETPSVENRRRFLEGEFNSSENVSKIWELAYSMRDRNAEIHRRFGEMFGKRMSDWSHSFDEYTDILRREIVKGETSNAPLPSYGPNYRKQEQNIYGKRLTRMLHEDPAEFDQAAFDEAVLSFGEAEFGHMEDGVFVRAASLTQDQKNFVIRKFLDKLIK